MDQLKSYAPILPEIVLALGAMGVLMAGVFRKQVEPGADYVSGWLAIALLAIVGVLIAMGGPGREVLFEGSFINDAFSRFTKVLMLGAAALVLVMSMDALARARILSTEICALILLAVVGMMLMVSAGNMIALFLGLELQSLALYVIAAIDRRNVRSSEAGLKYFVLGSLSSGMLLYGASLIYGFTGSVDFSVIATVAQGRPAAENVGLIVGLVFVLVGLAFKIGAVPFHMWTPDVYEGAPTPVTAFFAAAPKLAAMALLVRMLLQAFPGIASQWQQIIVFISIASMVLGAFAAIGQTNIKRLMAYSSIGHVGYALIGLAAFTEVGTQSLLIYLAIYIAMTLGTFACILSMRTADGPVEDVQSLAGLASTNLGMAFALAMLLFSMAGIPTLAGFFAKLYVFGAAIEAKLYMLAIIGVLSSVVGAYYYLRVVKVMFFDPATTEYMPVERGAGIVMAAATAFVLLFIILPAPLADAALNAARALHGGTTAAVAEPAPAAAAARAGAGTVPGTP
ncbi:NADH-quinone oxidoreductase subunit NuoN [Hyphomicrobium sulfonivorans]|uniref:NADH-quinone oxidoreductase subunit NuoN n=1 Tax=Hyphomicrobium sulfonivorans TaxID=121290 RepID=UPI00156DA047|nr:NADH-quinone oxidoreductase subunit NuoN [Hyphomicrobium sulfonivorans]MBI1650755.1 NADH-quinone oxidoreductase subunit NuoN [Hyphomicrobium sulfonivorans]NSL71887.1 NADH-quinone oxidoreductase subunit NuoN [Hyphomicrobium sulfonivorans]